MNHPSWFLRGFAFTCGVCTALLLILLLLVAGGLRVPVYHEFTTTSGVTCITTGEELTCNWDAWNAKNGMER